MKKGAKMKKNKKIISIRCRKTIEYMERPAKREKNAAKLEKC
jgi:hypothetical protein